MAFLSGGGLGGGLLGRAAELSVCEDTALRGLEAAAAAAVCRIEPKLCMFGFLPGERMDCARFTKFLVSSSLGESVSESEFEDSPCGVAIGMGAEISKFFSFSRSI